MNDNSNRCMVSGADGHVTVTPSGRVILTEVEPGLRGGDIDRIADEVGTDVVMRTLAANGGTAAMMTTTPDGLSTLTMSGRVGALVELTNAQWFIRPTGTSDHTVKIPGDALRFTVALAATGPSDLSPSTAARLSSPEGQTASQFVVDRQVAAQPDPTPVGIEVVNLSESVDFVPTPLPIVRRSDPAPAPSVIPPTPAPAPASAPDAPHDLVPTPSTPPVEADTDAAIDDHADDVLGIRCPLGHHNHPEAGYCSQCGRKMGINATAVLVMGPRPPLGLFLLDDGGAIPISSDLLIGRDAASHDDVRAGRRQAVLLSDPTNSVSRHHLAITLHDWTVTVTDLGSANGTMIVSGQSGQSVRLEAHRPVSMSSGDRLQIGPHALQLQLHHVVH